MKQGPTVVNTVRVCNTGSKRGGFVGVLKVVGGGAVIAKDALWSAIDLLGDAADALGKAPDTARSVTEGGRATLQGKWWFYYTLVPRGMPSCSLVYAFDMTDVMGLSRAELL